MVKEALIIKNQNEIRNKLYSSNEEIKKLEFQCCIDEVFSCQFEGCYNLDNVVFKKDVGIIETDAFTSCNIKKIFFYGNVGLIQKGAFSDNPIKEAFFSTDIQIEDRAFSDTDTAFTFLLLKDVSYPKLNLYALKYHIPIKIISLEQRKTSADIFDFRKESNSTLIISNANQIKSRYYRGRKDIKNLIFSRNYPCV